MADIGMFPLDSEVKILYDGAARADVDYIYLARNGNVILTDASESVYHTEDRPETAPTSEEKQYWKPKEEIIE